MIQDLLKKIEALIKNCPSDWARKAASKMEIQPSTVGRIRRGELGKRDCSQQIKLIQALKEIKTEYQESLSKALS